MADKCLSIFIDESGDFGPYEAHAPYYLVAMVLHDRQKDINSNIAAFEEHIHNLGYPHHSVHTGPLIRRESIYKDDFMEERKKLFNSLFNFARKLDIHYSCVKVDKSECEDVIALTSKLFKGIASFLRSNEDYFRSFARIIVYYDNGQIELTRVLTSVFNALYSNVEFRKVRPVDYKLFQVADLICTFELLEMKSTLSKSEQEFFGKRQDLRKNYLKPIHKKKL